MNGQGLSTSIDVADAVIGDYGGKKLEPDVAIYAYADGRNSSPRCVIEIEVHHRSPREARELAAVYFADQTVGAVVLLKVWGRRQDGTFAAACIVWVRPEGDEGGEANFGSIAAHEFGTAPMKARARNSLSGQNEDPVLPTPFVGADTVYAMPDLAVPFDGRSPQIVHIPALPLIVNGTTRQGEQLVDINPSIKNLELNLSDYIINIELNLPGTDDDGEDDAEDGGNDEEEYEHGAA